MTIIPPTKISSLQNNFSKGAKQTLSFAETQMKKSLEILKDVVAKKGIEPFVVETRNGVTGVYLNPEYMQFARILGVSIKI